MRVSPQASSRRASSCRVVTPSVTSWINRRSGRRRPPPPSPSPTRRNACVRAISRPRSARA
ncbi:hypothetical protein AA983_11775 [Dermacoccus sp. PE3]|nr:hypothetical protein AA983_11775 [Dermacoccus sp. PE3]